MDHVETRELRYFLALAAELHFGRAAERLGIAQPPLSRAIKQLERRVGAELVERGRRGVRFTPVGEVFAVEADKALAAVATAVHRTRRAASAASGLVLAMKAGGDGGLLPGILAAYRELPDAAHVEVVVCGAAERAGKLRDGSADLALLHSRYDDVTDFDTEPLRTEEAVVVVSKQHRLAGRDWIRLSELSGETFPRFPKVPTPDGVAFLDVHDESELMQHIALGRMVVVAPESVRGHLRRDLVGIPVPDAPDTTVLLAWQQDSRSPAIASFVHAATTAARQQS